MRRTAKLLAITGGTSVGVYWGIFNQQDRENTKGAYLSFISSCKSAWIVY